ncbi:MAG: zinc ribbon domain-containing protein [Pirellulaceae bacterium]|nr:zinc ribbon domain-containing protein [Pirellulaceae bacterium]
MPADTQLADVPAVDAESAAPSGKPCAACGTPVESLDKFCPACGTTNPDFRAPIAPTRQPEASARGAAPPAAAPSTPITAEMVESPLTKHFKCQTCGAEVATDPHHRSYVCPFCDSTYVVEFDPAGAGRQPPEFVIGFAITHDDAQQKFKEWLRQNSWFRPGDLAVASVADKLKGVYLPFWAFTMLAQSTWRAQIGEHWYRTETYTETDSKGNTVTKTRQVQETEWWPLAGRHHRYYSGYLVSGSKGLPQDQALRIQPFQLPALKRYEPYFLAGWLAEEYSVERDDALKLCRQEFARQESANIGAFLPGDTYSGLAVQTEFSQITSDLCLLPVYILSYRYREKVYRFLLNGQTGKMAGDKPLSGTRIAIAVAAGLFVVLIIVLVILLISGMR